MDRADDEKPASVTIRFPALGLVLGLCVLAWLLVSLVRTHAVNTPLWDDWERGPLLQKAESGELRFADLYAAHIQHRMVVPRLVTLALNGPAKGDLRWEMYLTLAQVLAAGVMLAMLAWRTLPGRPWLATGAGLLLAALALSPMQYQNLLWATQFAIVMPATALLAAIFIWRSGLPLAARYGLVALCALLGTHTFSHGLLLWPCLFLFPAFSARAGTGRTRLALCIGWLVLAAMVYGFYFHNLENVSHPAHAYSLLADTGKPRGLEAVFADPSGFWNFIMMMLGSGLARAASDPIDPFKAAVWLGTLQAVSALSLGVWFLLAAARGRHNELRERMLPWLVIAAFGLVATAAVAYGRAGILSEARALSPRYISISLHLTAGLTGAVAVLLARLSASRRFVVQAPAWAVGLATALALMLAANWIAGFHLAGAFKLARLQARAQLPLIHHIELPRHHLIDGTHDFLRDQAAFLHSKGWLKPGLLAEPYLDEIPRAGKPVSHSRGAILDITPNSEGWTITGHARTPGCGRPADAVVLCQEVDGKLRLLGVADAAWQGMRPLLHHDYEFSQIERVRLPERPRWTFDLRREMLAPEGGELSAWILNGERWRAHRISGVVDLSGETRDGLANE